MKYCTYENDEKGYVIFEVPYRHIYSGIEWSGCVRDKTYSIRLKQKHDGYETGILFRLPAEDFSLTRIGVRTNKVGVVDILLGKFKTKYAKEYLCQHFISQEPDTYIDDDPSIKYDLEILLSRIGDHTYGKAEKA